LAKYLYGDRIARQGKVIVGCNCVVLNEDRDEVLLIRRTDNGRWAVPGGALDAGESVLEACVREAKEETGLDVEITRFVGIYSDPNRLLVYADGNKYHVISLAFEAKVIGGDLSPNSEASEFTWAAVRDLKDLDLVEPQLERIQDALDGGLVIK
jgi:ADP-ribose pyrophosphatase YjhB (NUDIX family)